MIAAMILGAVIVIALGSTLGAIIAGLRAAYHILTH